MKRAAIALALVAATGCAASRPRAVIVEAEGWAAVDQADPEGSRRRALANAQEQAVEKASGLEITGRTRIRDGRLTSERIDSRARGRVLAFEVTSERHEEGLAKTRIRATVELEPLNAKASARCPAASLAIAIAPSSNPDWDRDVENALKRRLADAGCELRTPGDHPDLLLTARASASPFRDELVEPFVSSRAHLTVQAIESSTGNILWAGSADSTALGRDSAAASSRALSQAAAIAGSAAVSGLDDAAL